MTADVLGWYGVHSSARGCGHHRQKSPLPACLMLRDGCRSQSTDTYARNHVRTLARSLQQQPAVCNNNPAPAGHDQSMRDAVSSDFRWAHIRVAVHACKPGPAHELLRRAARRPAWHGVQWRPSEPEMRSTTMDSQATTHPIVPVGGRLCLWLAGWLPAIDVRRGWVYVRTRAGHKDGDLLIHPAGGTQRNTDRC